MLGYRYDHGTLVVVPEEAKTVKYIFSAYLAGRGVTAIAKKLNAENVPTRNGNEWRPCGIRRVLENEAYTGCLRLQKTFRENHISKRRVVNEGQFPRYWVENCHEAIITREQFAEVQNEIQRRAAQLPHKGKSLKLYPFSGKVVCGICGHRYRRKINSGRPIWICATYNFYGKDACPSKAIPEDTLTAIAAEVAPLTEMMTIRVDRDNTLVFTLADGTEVIKHWKDRSRAESWSDEMKEKARQKTLQRRSLQNGH